MFKVKNIVASAMTGFVLSFLISICATHRFGNSLLRGVLAAVIFGLLMVLIEVLDSKFLNGTVDSSLGDVSTARKDSRGANIDITIADEPLTEDDAPLKFDVKGNKRPLSKNDTVDIKSELSSSKIADVGENMGNIPAAKGSAGLDSIVKPVSDIIPSFTGGQIEKESEENKSAFKPIQLGKGNKASDNESEQHHVSHGRKSIAEAEKEAERKSIADLPDMDSMESEEREGTPSSTDSSIYQEDMVPSESIVRKPSHGNSKATSQDAETMAKAIRTLLSKD